MYSTFEEYEACASEVAMRLGEGLGPELVSLAGFGGVARSGSFFPGWSDLDFVVVLKSSSARSLRAINEVRNLDQFRDIPITLAVVDSEDVALLPTIVSPYNSVMLNVFANRLGTRRVFLGSFPSVSFTAEHEKRNAIAYVDWTVKGMRRFIAESGKIEKNFEANFQRILKWASSILRATLRIDGTMRLPYEASLEASHHFLTDNERQMLGAAFGLRRAWLSVSAGTHAASFWEVCQIVESIHTYAKAKSSQMDVPRM